MNTTKKCSKCKKDLELNQFCKNKTKKDGLGTYCKNCNKSNLSNHYEDNKEYYKNKKGKWDKEYREWYISVKKQYSCKKCGESHPACIQFHHLDPTNKKSTISSMAVQKLAKSKVLEEIKKCIPLCANCHAKEHYYLNEEC